MDSCSTGSSPGRWSCSFSSISPSSYMLCSLSPLKGVHILFTPLPTIIERDAQTISLSHLFLTIERLSRTVMAKTLTHHPRNLLSATLSYEIGCCCGFPTPDRELILIPNPIDLS